MSELPPVRRVVTGHDAAGKAVVIDDAVLHGQTNPTGTTTLTVVWTSLGLPVDNDEVGNGSDGQVALTLPGGSVIRMVDMLPGSTAPMHRTNSLDYGIVVSGVIELILDDGLRVPVEPGGIVVQRGTIHSWHNPSAEETARIAFVLIDAKPATADGVALAEIHPSEGRRP